MARPSFLVTALFAAFAATGAMTFQSAGSAAAETGKPEAVVEAFHETLIATMRTANGAGAAQRHDQLEPAINETFHLPLMAQVVAGTAWRNTDEETRRRLVDALANLSASTYATRFDEYTGQRFETAGTRDGPRGTVLVDTRLIIPDRDPVRLTYVTRQFGERWQIVDVLVDGGISELAVRRSEYRQTLKSGGIGALIDALNAKAHDLLAG